MTPDVLKVSYPTTDTAGTAQSFTVTAISPTGASDTHYTGTIHFTSSDPQAVLPSNYIFTSTDSGDAHFHCHAQDSRHPIDHRS